MGDHLGSIHFEFFQWQKCRQIRQICQILLISLNYEKTQIFIILKAFPPQCHQILVSLEIGDKPEPQPVNI